MSSMVVRLAEPLMSNYISHKNMDIIINLN